MGILSQSHMVNHTTPEIRFGLYDNPLALLANQRFCCCAWRQLSKAKLLSCRSQALQKKHAINADWWTDWYFLGHGLVRCWLVLQGDSLAWRRLSFAQDILDYNLCPKMPLLLDFLRRPKQLWLHLKLVHIVVKPKTIHQAFPGLTCLFGTILYWNGRYHWFMACCNDRARWPTL